MEMEAERKNGVNEDLARMYEESISDVKEGQIIKGKIVQIGDKDILVDIGYKSEGIIHKSEVSSPEELEVGGEIDVILEAKENDDGMVVLSHEKAKRYKGWQNIVDNHKEGDILDGKVLRKVRGGFMVDVGMDAFLPASLSSMQDFGGADNLLGKKLTFKIVKINIQRKNIVLSRKELVEEKRKEEKQAILEDMNKGDVVKGIVRNITDFGAFIDIGGGITGLLHITDMSWGRINHPSEIVKVGDEIEVKVLDFDKESVRVSLGLKQSQDNPWENVNERYPEGGAVKGTVVNIMPYGIFVELEKGIEGLIHISEFSWSKKFNHPGEKFKVGDIIEAVVLKIDKDNQKLSLGIKQLGKDPWEGVEQRHSVGDQITGTIIAVTDYGAFVELSEDIDGLIHVSDLSWTKRITHPKDILKKGEEIKAIILNVDEQNRRIALGVKQLSQDPWDEIIKRYNPDTECDGKVTNITNFGMFVELEDDLEGLLHVSEIELAPGTRMETLYDVGDIIKVKIMHIDGVQKKIALSKKGLDPDLPKEPKASAETEQSPEVPAEETADAPKEPEVSAEVEPSPEAPAEETAEEPQTTPPPQEDVAANTGDAEVSPAAEETVEPETPPAAEEKPEAAGDEVKE